MSNLFSLNFYTRNAHWIGAVGIIISLAAWMTDFSGLVYICPYCRLQRTVIGLLGLLLLLKAWRHWLFVYIGSVLAFLGAHVASAQHFNGWIKINKGEFILHQPFYVDPFLLSGCALFIIVAEIWLLALMAKKPRIPQ